MHSGVRPVEARHELHVVLLRGGLHPREVRDERRLVLVGWSVAVPICWKNRSKPPVSVPEHPGGLLDPVGVRRAGRHEAEVAGVSSSEIFAPSASWKKSRTLPSST